MDDDNKLHDHEFDGIKELDNDLPRWWIYLFYITIIWSVLYYLYYHVFDIGYLSVDEYRSEMDPNYVRIESANNKLLGIFNEYHSPWYNPEADMIPGSKKSEKSKYVEMTASSDTTRYELLTDANSIEFGSAIFKKNCVQCHGSLGEGGIGPNLTDSYWIHGGEISDIVKSVTYGYPAKGMVSWRGTIKPDQILQVSSYIYSIAGSNPPNAKAPQGELVTR